MTVIRLLSKGLDRVMDGQIGMTFIVDSFTDKVDNSGQVAHVRDYRYGRTIRDYQIWSIGPEGYKIIEES